MNVLIIEDEAMVARRLLRFLADILPKTARLEHRRTFEAGQRRLEEGNIDLLFLDLDVGGYDGFEMLPRFAGRPASIVVVSAHHDQALRAFEHGVVDFVPKPFRYRRLLQAVERALSVRPPVDGGKFLAVRRHGVVTPVSIRKLVRAHGAGDYSELHLEDGSTELYGRSIGRLDEELPPTFERIHRSIIVRITSIAELRADAGSRYRVVLSDGTEVPVGRSRVASLRSRLF